jgi:hypothetical protein
VFGLIVLVYNFERIAVSFIIRDIEGDNSVFEATGWSRNLLDKAAQHIIKQHDRSCYILSLAGNSVSTINLKINCWNALLDIAKYVSDDSRSSIEKYCNTMLLDKKLDRTEESNYRQYILFRLNNCNKKDVKYYESILSGIERIHNEPRPIPILDTSPALATDFSPEQPFHVITIACLVVGILE